MKMTLAVILSIVIGAILPTFVLWAVGADPFIGAAKTCAIVTGAFIALGLGLSSAALID
jgi:hypothetical protein